MTIPHMPLSEVIFLIFVLSCFAAFAFTLAGVHVYVNLAPVRQARSKTAASHPSSLARADHIVTA
ncbi:MAG TPA: hypothetical protein VKQ54_04985 [Caulobacteraceae bacterium]|nr:hypothetical protein [Caulobacteraceae bacterium]